MNILFCATVDIHIRSFHLPLINDLKKDGNSIDLVSNGNDEFEDISNKFNIPFSRNPLSFSNILAYFEIKKILKENSYDVISTHTPIASFIIRLAAKKFKLRNNGKVVLINGVGLANQKYKISIDKSRKRHELGLLDTDFIMLSVGELSKRKNHMFVLECVKDKLQSNKNMKYVICGTGPLENELKQYIDNNDLKDNVVLLGYRNDIQEIMLSADIFIFPSIQEGLTVSVIEAMIAGLPILASNIRGNNDLVVSNENGYLFELDNKESFLHKFDMILKSNLDDISKNNILKSKIYSYEMLKNSFLDIYR
ncbi:MAG: glycosyltransferase [Bacilli bacterium]